LIDFDNVIEIVDGWIDRIEIGDDNINNVSDDGV
jgi:hypothetical protein